MNKKTQYIAYGVLVVLGVLGLFFPRMAGVGSLAGASSPVGTTNSTAKFYQVVMTPSTSAASSTSLLNTDGTDRVISSSQGACTGVGTSLSYLTGAGIASWTVNMATSSTAAQTGSVNYAANLTISTSSALLDYVAASTTTPFPNDIARIWPAGTYLTITFNATNTATCTLGVHTLSL